MHDGRLCHLLHSLELATDDSHNLTSYYACPIWSGKRSHIVRYVLAIFLPPLAILLCGKPFQALINILLCLLFWIPGMLHALFVVNSYLADRRMKELARALGGKV